MKRTIFLVLIAVTTISHGCSDVSPDAVDLQVDFSWEGMEPCGWGIPEVGIRGVPENTKYLVVDMYDHAYFFDHGEVKVIYNGSNIISRDSLKKIYCPCPLGGPADTKLPSRLLMKMKLLSVSEAKKDTGQKNNDVMDIKPGEFSCG